MELRPDGRRREHLEFSARWRPARGAPVAALAARVLALRTGDRYPLSRGPCAGLSEEATRIGSDYSASSSEHILSTKTLRHPSTFLLLLKTPQGRL